MPWRNGGGETWEIARAPADAAIEAMDWRISMALVADDGPFSSFPGIDRTLSILDGKGLILYLGEDATPLTLTDSVDPFGFRGEIPVHSRLLEGAVTDLNVMTRRAAYRHVVKRVTVQGQQIALATAAEVLVVCCCEGEIECGDAEEPKAALRPRDCAVFHAPFRHVRLRSPSVGRVLIAEIYRTFDSPAPERPPESPR